ncbi:MAG: hypothetical protein Q9180_005526 [Flavoplaca navasiana]
MSSSPPYTIQLISSKLLNVYLEDMNYAATLPLDVDLDLWAHEPGPSCKHLKIQSQPHIMVKPAHMVQSKFQQLPAELRLKIYSFSLISTSAIIVRSAQTPGGRPRPAHLKWNREKMSATRSKLALGLLRCSTNIAAESAQIFYSHNTFYFEGEHEYYPIITWLDKLNHKREWLRYLEIDVRRPEVAWQLPDGSRHRMHYSRTRGLASHHPYFTAPVGPYEEGEVDIIDPAIETIISLLAKDEHGDHRKMTLSMNTGFYNIPGIELFEDEGTCFFSLDLPNLVDVWRTKYCLNTKFELGIIWKVETDLGVFHENRHLIEGVGWNIVDACEGEVTYNPYGIHDDRGEDRVLPTMQVSMKRNAIGDSIMAAGASPWTRSHHNPLDPEWN